MAGAHVQIYLWTFDRGWPQQYIIQKCMSGIYDVNVEGNSLVMCSWLNGRIPGLDRLKILVRVAWLMD